MELIEKYESLSREEIAYHVTKKMKPMKLSRAKECRWIAEHCLHPGATRDSVGHWFSPSRRDKMPLKVLVRFSVEMNVDLMELLEKPHIKNMNFLRRGQRESYEDKVKEYVIKHPNSRMENIAKALNISEGNVRRHLGNLYQQKKLSLDAQIQKAEKKIVEVDQEKKSHEKSHNMEK